MSVTSATVGVSVTSIVVRVAVCATAVVEDPDPDDVDDEAHDGHRLDKKIRQHVFHYKINFVLVF